MTETSAATPAPAFTLPWKKTVDELPKKPGKKSYEHVYCLAIVKGDTVILAWNCEHECWDDETGDDFKYDPTVPTWWIALSDIPGPPGTILC